MSDKIRDGSGKLAYVPQGSTAVFEVHITNDRDQSLSPKELDVATLTLLDETGLVVNGVVNEDILGTGSGTGRGLVIDGLLNVFLGQQGNEGDTSTIGLNRIRIYFEWTDDGRVKTASHEQTYVVQASVPVLNPVP